METQYLLWFGHEASVLLHSNAHTAHLCVLVHKHTDSPSPILGKAHAFTFKGLALTQ